MIDITVDSRIRMRERDLPKEVALALREEHEHKNPEFGSKQAMGYPTFGIPRTIKTWGRSRGGELSFPRGGMARVRACLREAGVPFRVIDGRTEGTVCRFPEYVGHDMRWYQEAAIEAALEKEQCVIRAPTGSGKTEMALALIERIGLNALVILPTGPLFKQWKARAKDAFGSRVDIGEIQGPKRKLRPITVAMQQTLSRGGVTPEDAEFFGAVIVDEAQLAAARTYVEVIDQFPARFRIAISADERRKDRKEFLAYDLFSDVAYDVRRDVLEEEGHVLDVEMRVIPTDFRADWYGIPENDEDDHELDFNRLLDEMSADPRRNELALRFIVEEARTGEQAIVLTSRREHVRDLDRMLVGEGLRTGYFLGKETAFDEREFERTRAGIMDGSVAVGIGTYKALGFGIDLPAVSVGVAVTPIAGNAQNLNQVRGRLCRPNPKAGKTGGRLYVMWDRHVYPGHLRKIMAKNKSVVVWNGKRWVPGQEFAGRSYAFTGAQRAG